MGHVHGYSRLRYRIPLEYELTSVKRNQMLAIF